MEKNKEGAPIQRLKSILEWSNVPREEKKEVQEESPFRRFQKSFQEKRPLEKQRMEEEITLKETNYKEELALGLQRKMLVRKIFYTNDAMEKKNEEMRRKAAIEMEELDLAIRRTTEMLKVFESNDPAERR